MNFNQKAGEESHGGLFDYVNRNSAWLMPAAATVMAVATPALMMNMAPEAAVDLPRWLIPSAAVLGAAAMGFGASRTDTASAAVVQVLGFAAAAGLVLVNIFR